MKDHDRAPAGVGVDDSQRVAADAFVGVVAIDEREVHVTVGRRKLGQDLREHRRRVTDVEGRVLDLLGELRDLGHDVEGMDLAGVRADPSKAATPGRTRCAPPT